MGVNKVNRGLNALFALCAAAMVVLHSALLKLLQAFFDNFQSDFRVQEAAGKRHIRDVEENTEVFQLNISALYQLRTSWTSRYVQKMRRCVLDGVHSLPFLCVLLTEVTSASPCPVT